MIRGLYTAASGLIANLRQQEYVANNIANVSTPGYKGDIAAVGSFASVLATSVGNAPSPMPLTFRRTIGIVGTGAYVAQRSSYLADGELRLTDSALDLAIRGPGFFAVQGPQGTLYTRNGHFARRPDGLLVTSDGFALLDTNGEVLLLPPGEIRLDEIAITRDGTIHVGDQQIGRLQMVEIPAGRLVRASASTFVAAGIQDPAPVGAGTVLIQRALEESNIDVVRAATQLFAVSQQFGANQQVFTTVAENLRLAVREVGRVG